MEKLKVGLFGSNGHQVVEQIPGIEEIELVAVCGMNQDSKAHRMHSPIAYESYEEFLMHPGMQLVSICSPERSRQHEDIKAALRVGKHVYAEKPLAMDESQLDEIVLIAKSRNLHIREMASTVYELPYWEMREIVASGRLGDIVQVFVQKSYPYADWRPQAEEVDGGLILQVGVHACRLVEHMALRQIQSISAVQTRLGNLDPSGELHMAASFQMRLDNGGLGSVIVNYLNSSASGVWGNDEMRIFGTAGYMESLDGGKCVNVVTDAGRERLQGFEDRHHPSHFQQFVREILGFSTSLLPLVSELRPLRSVLRARQSAIRQGEFFHV